MSASLPTVAGMLLILAAAPAAAPHEPVQDSVAQSGRDRVSSLAVRAADADPPDIYLVGELRVTRPSLQGEPDQTKAASAYLEIDNRGLAPDQLVAATVGVADHVSIVGGGAAGSDGLAIAPGETLDLRAGGPHLALEGLHAPLKDGDRIAGTLRFRWAGPLPIEFNVEKSDGGAAPNP